MPAHRLPAIPAEVLQTRRPVQPGARRPSLPARLVGRLRARTCDRQLSVGMPPAASNVLRAHRDRLLSSRERRAVADTLRGTVDDALAGTVSMRVPLDAPGILAAADLIDRIASLLESPDPVCERGVARLRLLLSDGAGPLYRHGHGDLRGRLGAALAAL